MSSDRLPTEPGLYYWDTWNREVRVYQRGSDALWVRVFSHWPPVKISPRIVGKFTKVEPKDLANANVTA